jgi:hypothetical protein
VVIVPAIQGEALVNPQNRIEDACVGVLGGQLAFDVRVESQGTGTVGRWAALPCRLVEGFDPESLDDKLLPLVCLCVKLHRTALGKAKNG